MRQLLFSLWIITRYSHCDSVFGTAIREAFFYLIELLPFACASVTLVPMSVGTSKMLARAGGGWGIKMRDFSVKHKFSKYKTIFPLSQLPKSVVVAVVRSMFTHLYFSSFSSYSSFSDAGWYWVISIPKFNSLTNFKSSGCKYSVWHQKSAILFSIANPIIGVSVSLIPSG